MPLVTSKEMLLKAQKGGYAVGAFNAENMEMVKAIIQAAEELKAPVAYPEGVGPGTYEAEPEEEPAGIASPGEYTKQVSGMTEAEMYLSFLSDN